MKDIYKNPIFYYAVVPVVAALWPLLIWGVYLPGAEKKWNTEKAQYEKAQKIITEILSLDPGRLQFASAEGSKDEFDYATAVQKVAEYCKIPYLNYKLSSGIMITSKKQKSQSANVNLKSVDIVKFSRFLATLQLRWPNLQCSKVKLNKKKGAPDIWDVDLAFKYYY